MFVRVYINKGALEKLEPGATWRSGGVDNNNLSYQRATSTSVAKQFRPHFFISRCFTQSGITNTEIYNKPTDN